METSMKRFALITLLCCVFLIRTHALALDTIRIAYSSVNPHALLVSMAEKRGLYGKYGLSSTIVYVSGGSTVIQAMVSGDIDLGQLTGAPGVTANLRGADIVYIAMSDDRMGYQLVTRRDVKNAADLKGKRIGISRFGSSSEFGAPVVGRPPQHIHRGQTENSRRAQGEDRFSSFSQGKAGGLGSVSASRFGSGAGGS